MTAIFIDSSNPRLLFMRYPQDTRIEYYVASVEELFERNPDQQKFAILMDMRDARALIATAQARKEAAAVMEQHKDWFTEALVCTARVASDPVLRGELTVYDFHAPGPWPRKSFSSGPIAESWVRGRLEAAGVPCDATAVWRE